jgi:hypothetical protein
MGPPPPSNTSASLPAHPATHTHTPKSPHLRSSAGRRLVHTARAGENIWHMLQGRDSPTLVQVQHNPRLSPRPTLHHLRHQQPSCHDVAQSEGACAIRGAVQTCHARHTVQALHLPVPTASSQQQQQPQQQSTAAALSGSQRQQPTAAANSHNQQQQTATVDSGSQPSADQRAQGRLPAGT